MIVMLRHRNLSLTGFLGMIRVEVGGCRGAADRVKLRALEVGVRRAEDGPFISIRTCVCTPSRYLSSQADASVARRTLAA